MLIQMLSNFVLAWSEIKSKADVFVLSELMFFILSENRTCLLWTEWHCLLTSVMLLLLEKGANIKGKWNCVLVQRSGLANCVNMMHCLFKEFLIYKHTRLNSRTIEGKAIILLCLLEPKTGSAYFNTIKFLTSWENLNEFSVFTIRLFYFPKSLMWKVGVSSPWKHCTDLSSEETKKSESEATVFLPSIYWVDYYQPIKNGCTDFLMLFS